MIAVLKGVRGARHPFLVAVVRDIWLPQVVIPEGRVAFMAVIVIRATREEQVLQMGIEKMVMALVRSGTQPKLLITEVAGKEGGRKARHVYGPRLAMHVLVIVETILVARVRAEQ
jgi:hypothetical protein